MPRLSIPFKNFDDEYNFISAIKNRESPASLFNITIARISRLFWLRDIQLKIDNLNAFGNVHELKNHRKLTLKDKWSEIEEKVLENISKLIIPQSFKRTLRETVKLIGDQLFNFLFRSYSDKSKVHIYLQNLKWTSRGMIDIVKTTLFLLKLNLYHPMEKYELSCNICDEEKIKYYFELSKLARVSNVFDKKLSLLVYWTLRLQKHQRLGYFRRQENELPQLSESDFKFMFRWSCHNNNEIALWYFIKKCRENSILENLISCAESIIQDNSTILLPYLMAHMNPNQLQNYCTRNGFELINKFVKDWRLESCILPTSRSFLKFIKKMDLIHAFKFVILCWNANLFKEGMCKKLLHNLINDVGEVREERFKLMCNTFLNSLFGLHATIETIKLLLSKGSFNIKSQIIYSPFGLQECSELIIKGEFEYVEVFINEMVGTENVSSFKSSFFRSYSFEITSKLIIFGKYEILNKFLASFSCGKEIRRFKLEILKTDQASIICNIFNCSSYIGLAQTRDIDKFLYWCFEGDLLKLENFKEEIFEKDPNYNMLQKLFCQQIFEFVRKGDLELVKNYLKWAFSKYHTILKFKERCFQRFSFDAAYYFITEDKYELLDEFLNMFCLKNEISTFKFSLPASREGKIIKELQNMTNPTNAEGLILKFLDYSFEKNEENIAFMTERVVDQGRDVDFHCWEIFLTKISSLMKSNERSLLDKYMKWAFAVST